VPVLLSNLATQALLHPTMRPLGSRGPMSGWGHAGFRSTGHEATVQFCTEGMISIGRLNPSTRDTTSQPLHEHQQSIRCPSEGSCKSRTIIKVAISFALECPLRHRHRRRTLHRMDTWVWVNVARGGRNAQCRYWDHIGGHLHNHRRGRQLVHYSK
jgi:hypothetical protein